jgi:cell division septation protein DedD
MKMQRIGQMVALLVTAVALAGCEQGAKPFGFLGGGDGAAGTSEASVSTRLVERDVEAPEVFSLTDQGLWDGRPSLGGVWVAHASVTDPERAIIRNTANGKFVIGALFRREREMPGPNVQVSSDAAAALGMLAGQPAELSVIALRREEVAPAAPVTPEAAPDTLPAASETIESLPLDRVTATAEAAIVAAETGTTTATPSALTKPYVQIGIFSVEANANRAAEQLRSAGMTPTVKQESSHGKTFWRVIAGPVASVAERGTLIGTIKTLGYPDAYAVSN